MLGSSHLVSPHRGVARDVELHLLAALRLPATTGQRLVLTALLTRQMRSALLAGLARSACRCQPACRATASTASAWRRSTEELAVEREFDSMGQQRWNPHNSK